MVLMLKTRSNRVLSGDYLAVIDLAQPHSCVVHSRRKISGIAGRSRSRIFTSFYLIGEWGQGRSRRLGNCHPSSRCQLAKTPNKGNGDRRRDESSSSTYDTSMSTYLTDQHVMMHQVAGTLEYQVMICKCGMESN